MGDPLGFAHAQDLWIGPTRNPLYPIGTVARAILEGGLADVLAADNHGDYRSLAAAARYLEGRGAGRAITRLTEQNPGAVIRDADMAPVAPVRLPERWVERVMRFFRG